MHRVGLEEVESMATITIDLDDDLARHVEESCAARGGKGVRNRCFHCFLRNS